MCGRTGAVRPPRLAGHGVYGFDSNGNMTQDPRSGTTTYTFNGDNRVTTAV